jgi:hypothetical protein
MLTFTTTLKTDDETGTARYIELPPEIAAALPAKSKMRVKGTLNRVPFQTSLAKYRETGYVFPMKKSLRDAVGVDVGGEIIVSIEPNHETHPPLPADVAAALAATPAAQTLWNRLPPSHQREYLNHINDAKKADTRARRIAKMIEMIGK